jgi:hypothetical protein
VGMARLGEALMRKVRSSTERAEVV